VTVTREVSRFATFEAQLVVIAARSLVLGGGVGVVSPSSISSRSVQGSGVAEVHRDQDVSHASWGRRGVVLRLWTRGLLRGG
jgi:hypothetical protein